MEKKIPYQPWAEKYRPQSLDEIVGQSHLIGPNKPLRVCFESGQPHNMLFCGPPGVGKTSLARLAAHYFSCEFVAISAVFAGVKDIRALVDTAMKNQSLGQNTLVFIDEIHRFNKSQQDALLPYTESGLITIIGATTENPAFELNRALLSRCRVYSLKSLHYDELDMLLCRVWDQEVLLQSDVKQSIIQWADGDARRLMNFIQTLSGAVSAKKLRHIDLIIVHDLMGDLVRGFDKQGDIFYDQISALHKSVRGSNPDAALYWFARMLDAGVDMQYLSRRIIRMAWEDIGLADPKAMQIANDAAQTYERLGSPEGELALASAIVYLSVAAKSNSVYLALKKAQDFVKLDGSREVPLHLRNRPQGYRYTHDEPHGYAAGTNYWPTGLDAMQWYCPVNRGLEIKITNKMNFLKSLD